MKLTVLGTSCMVPTKDRNVSGYYLDYTGEGILFDCGEGTQRQMNIAGINRNKVKKILVTHWHGDHVSGIVGLIQTMGNAGEDVKLSVYGPKGSKEKMFHLMRSCSFDTKVDVQVFEIEPKNLETIYENDLYMIQAAKLYHTITCIGYRFVEKDRLRIKMSKLKKEGVKEGPHLKKLHDGKDMTYKGKTYLIKDYTSVVKGKVFAYVPDTMFGPSCVLLAQDADVLLCEATFDHSLVEKAHEKRHGTSQQAAQLAQEANVKKLLLTHFSQRYKDLNDVLRDAKDVFPDVECAFDFMKVKF
jgi:ribonuclease Z